jgi:hypothetical protein
LRLRSANSTLDFLLKSALNTFWFFLNFNFYWVRQGLASRLQIVSE